MNTRVSIAMAVYNGEKYIREQIDSILIQLQENDELIVSYDTSTDDTWRIINEYASNDKRVKVSKNPNKGVVSNFQNALSYCSGKYIFYADQDDVWMPNKIKKVLKKFEDPKVAVVIHDCSLTDLDLNVTHSSTFKLRNGNTSIIKNFIRLSYIGCAMAFRGEFLPIVTPLPTKKRSHDWWTGTICSCFGKMEIIDEPLILHRQHANNVTPKRRPPLKYQISVRYIILINVVKRWFLYRKHLAPKLYR